MKKRDYNNSITIKDVIWQALKVRHGITEVIAHDPETAAVSSPGTMCLLAECLSTSDGPHIEIGTRYGGSAIFASAFTNNSIYCIDPMDWYEPHDWDHPQYKEGVIGSVGMFKRNVAMLDVFGLSERVHLIVAYSNPFPISVPDGYFATAYIDGDHSYDGVRADFENLKNKVSKYMVFDDMYYPTVYFAVIDSLHDNPEWELVHMNTNGGVLMKIGDITDETWYSRIDKPLGVL